MAAGGKAATGVSFYEGMHSLMIPRVRGESIPELVDEVVDLILLELRILLG